MFLVFDSTLPGVPPPQDPLSGAAGLSAPLGPSSPSLSCGAAGAGAAVLPGHRHPRPSVIEAVDTQTVGGHSSTLMCTGACMGWTCSR